MAVLTCPHLQGPTWLGAWSSAEGSFSESLLLAPHPGLCKLGCGSPQGHYIAILAHMSSSSSVNSSLRS